MSFVFLFHISFLYLATFGGCWAIQAEQLKIWFNFCQWTTV